MGRGCQQAPDREATGEEGEDEQRHRHEAAETDPVAEDEVDGLEHDELAADEDGPSSRPAVSSDRVKDSLITAGEYSIKRFTTT